MIILQEVLNALIENEDSTINEIKCQIENLRARLQEHEQIRHEILKKGYGAFAEGDRK